ncbi:MAG: PKD domain-containing protein, partial [Ferruginibacter sp.]|nr:PKD domain-containing protein [Cytophagales bacterium]
MRKCYFVLVGTVLSLLLLLPGYQGFAQFSASPSAGCAPLLVTFTGPAGEYDFDGATGPQGFVPTGANPGRQYLAPNTYQVLYRPNATGLVSAVATINVYPKPTPAFDVTEVAGVPGKVGVATGCAPLTVRFADASSSPPAAPLVGWTWYFGDGSTSTDQNPPPHTYAQTGIYTVELVVRTANCQENIKRTDVVVVTEPPDVDFSVDRTGSCGSATVQFTNTSTKLGNNPQYQWEFRDAGGNPIATSTDENPSVLFTTETSYTAKLTVKDASGCVSTKEKPNVFRISNNYVIDFSYAIDQGSCRPIKVRFTSQFLDPANVANQQVDWEVYDPNGVLVGTISGLNPEYNFSSPGTYQVRATSSGGTYNCPVNKTPLKDIQIESGGEAKFTSTNREGCQLPHIATFDASTSVNVAGNSYAWDFGDGTLGTGVNPTHTYANYGDYTVKLTITDANGCPSTVKKDQEVRVLKVNAAFGAYLTYGCNDANGDFPVNFIDQSNSPVPVTSWKWEFFDEANQLVGTVQGSDPNVHKNPTFTFNTVNANDGRAQYSVKLTVTTADGCSGAAERKNYIKVGDKPRAGFTANPPYGCPNTTVNFTYTGIARFDSLYWFPLGYGGTRINRTTNQNPNLDYTYNVDPGTYVAGLVVWNGGCSDSTHYRLNNPTDPKFTQLAPRARANWFIDQCNPGGVYFTDRSLGAQFWRWDFGSAAVPNAYPAGAAIRDFLPGTVPTALRNPVVNYPGPGTYAATLFTEADNVYYVTDPVTGARLPNSAGTSITYTTNPNEGNAPLHFGSVTTSDSVLLIRCRSQETLTVVVPGTTATVDIDSDYLTTNPNCFPVVVNFQNKTAGAASWYWILGNGQVSTEENPAGIVYDKPGKYTVELVITTGT